MNYDNIAKRQTATRSPEIDADEVAGLLAARREFGDAGEQAVIAAFLERTGRMIDARVDERLAQHRWAPAPDRRNGAKLFLAIASMILGIPLTGIAHALHPVAGVILVLVVWIAIITINVSFHQSQR
jgi:hypothetical protein